MTMMINGEKVENPDALPKHIINQVELYKKIMIDVIDELNDHCERLNLGKDSQKNVYSSFAVTCFGSIMGSVLRDSKEETAELLIYFLKQANETTISNLEELED